MQRQRSKQHRTTCMLAAHDSGYWQARAIAKHSVKSTSLHLPVRPSNGNVLILNSVRLFWKHLGFSTVAGLLTTGCMRAHPCVHATCLVFETWVSLCIGLLCLFEWVFVMVFGLVSFGPHCFVRLNECSSFGSCSFGSCKC